MTRSRARDVDVENRVISIAKYAIDTGATVREMAIKFGVSKSTVHKDVTLKNGLQDGQVIPECIEIKKVFLAEKNPIVKLGLIIK